MTRAATPIPVPSAIAATVAKALAAGFELPETIEGGVLAAARDCSLDELLVDLLSRLDRESHSHVPFTINCAIRKLRTLIALRHSTTTPSAPTALEAAVALRIGRNATAAVAHARSADDSARLRRAMLVHSRAFVAAAELARELDSPPAAMLLDANTDVHRHGWYIV